MSGKARVEIIDPQSASGEIARFFEVCTQAYGRVPNSIRVWAHMPFVANFQLLSGAPVQREGAGAVLSTRIKEMAVLRTSHLNGCAY